MDSIKDFGSKTWSSFRHAVGAGEEEDIEESGSASLLGQLSEATTLTRMQRLYGFGTCMGMGIFFSLMSQLFLLSPRRFGTCYTFGNLLSIGAMMFLMGPWNQIKNMFKKGRWIATMMYFGALVGTLYAAIGLQSSLLTLIFIALQFCALVWYSLSYIPYAREVLMRIFSSCLGDEE
mmetsp:Transcript_37687/g.106464  ORF Transcript_37687/g.106464 Transcript_37687/m.106464 type:complete len:177 (-) Transcript_37687:509-1039(-)|eukprot:CAMPEP_0117660482 /NCGR_PEP_ID=MMETSP0804-20121206/6992_1 /TAXON_ID=1074897 /ORGANISM="Tetraselmis astigmatica, Strain CCMP880" /LENGTH=176 /DNA_ID=CAMNT_0005467215 /DNA_START=398 /DNA_END=928 /DNA_ORIENTATION=-